MNAFLRELGLHPADRIILVRYSFSFKEKDGMKMGLIESAGRGFL